MKKIFTLPTWQVFIFLILPAVFPSNYVGLALTGAWFALLAYCNYFLGRSLYTRLPVEHDLSIKRFNFHFFFPLIYLLIVYIVFKGGYEIHQDNYKNYGWSLAVIIPLHVFTMYCLFYVIWFIGKAIATIEQNKVVAFDNYAGNFFLLWFFPIGVWFMHPKIRKIFSVDQSSLSSSL